MIDPAGPGAGASGGVLGALAPHVPENWNAKKAFQLDSLLAAPAFWAGVEAAGGASSGYGRTGRLQPVADAAALALAQDRARSAADLWRGAAVWELVPAGGDWAPASPSGWLIRDTLSARLHPRRAVEALAAALRARGVEILPEAPEQGAVLHATGAAGLAELSLALGRPVGTAVKGQAALLAHAATDAPQLFVEGLHVVPHADGTTAVGSTDERDFTDASATDDRLEALIAKRAAPGAGAGRRRRCWPAGPACARAPAAGRRCWAPGRAGRGISSPTAASRSASAWRRKWPR